MRVLKFQYIFLTILFIISCCSPDKANYAGSPAKKVQIGSLDNMYMLSDSVYRSEQPTANDFSEIYSYGIRSVLNLRESNTDDELIKGTALNLYKVQMNAANLDEGKIIQAMKIIKNAPKPILIHCMHGSDRTGAVAAFYRIIVENWSKEDAIKEMKYGNFGFHSVFVNIPNFIEEADIDKMKQEIAK